MRFLQRDSIPSTTNKTFDNIINDSPTSVFPNASEKKVEMSSHGKKKVTIETTPSQMPPHLSRRLLQKYITSKPLRGYRSKGKDWLEKWGETKNSQKIAAEILKYKTRYKKLRHKIKKWKKHLKNFDKSTDEYKSALSKLKAIRDQVNRFGYLDYIAAYNAYYQVGFFFDVSVAAHRYYYAYMKNIYDYDVLSDILSEILNYKFNLSPVNGKLCTFGNIGRVEVNLTVADKLTAPQC
mmetsp:Transcript_1937/g.2625  ORF Transcript_1937/g.2625 Transcript_1937/m.2625 type:complete len:237 (-) Transcript_1937:264-974(-)